MDLEVRASRHAALGDPRRLRIVDELRSSDMTVSDLRRVAGLPGNLLAHHLDVLEDAGLIERRASEGDGRRRYVSLLWDSLPGIQGGRVPPDARVVFVCTHNSARSQFAAALWRQHHRSSVASAGSRPADRVHPTAIGVASEHGVDLSEASPRGYEMVPWEPDLVVSVCDRAFESGLPWTAPRVHWSIPDPVSVGDRAAFRSAFADISVRVARLAGDL